MNKFWAVGTIVVVGVIVADVLTHPQGTQAAGAALNQTLATSFAAMLGNVPGGFKKAS